MFTNQSNNKSKIYIQKEQNHNLISLVYSSISILLLFIILLLSISNSLWTLIPMTIIFLSIQILKLFQQIKSVSGFKRLVSKVDDENLPFYITKSWTRKKQSTIWIGSLSIFFVIYNLIITGILFITLEMQHEIAVIILIFFILIIVLLTVYSNLTIIRNNIQISNRIFNFSDIEWEVTLKDQKIAYRNIFFYSVSFLLIIPLFLLVIPAYKNYINELIEK